MLANLVIIEVSLHLMVTRLFWIEMDRFSTRLLFPSRQGFCWFIVTRHVIGGSVLGTISSWLSFGIENQKKSQHQYAVSTWHAAIESVLRTIVLRVLVVFYVIEFSYIFIVAARVGFWAIVGHPVSAAESKYKLKCE